MPYQLQPGDICWRCDLPPEQGYRQYTWVDNPFDVERMAEELHLLTVPYAIVSGCGEIWVCYEDDFNQRQSPYEFVEHQGPIQ